MIDAHCHLHGCSDFPIGRHQILADFDETLRPKMLSLSSHPNTFCVIGTHPWQYKKEDPKQWIDMFDRAFATENSIVGIGEIGLDYFRAKEKRDRDQQLELLKTQEGIARKFEMPLVLHCVKAHQELLASLASFEFGGMIHGFRSSYEIAKRYVEAGFLISIGSGIHSKTGDKLRQAVRKIGVGHLVVESDALTFEDASMDKTLHTLAEIFKLDIESVETIMDENLVRVFPGVKG